MMLRRQEDEGQRKGGGSFRDKVGEESKLQWGEQCELRRWGNVPRPGSLAAHGGGVEMDTEDYRSFSCQDSLTLSSQLCKEAKASSQVIIHTAFRGALQCIYLGQWFFNLSSIRISWKVCQRDCWASPQSLGSVGLGRGTSSQVSVAHVGSLLRTTDMGEWMSNLVTPNPLPEFLALW
nr:uncharacterized protein LOC105863756 isoform X2 [Microcebus murinus]